MLTVVSEQAEGRDLDRRRSIRASLSGLALFGLSARRSSWRLVHVLGGLAEHAVGALEEVHSGVQTPDVDPDHVLLPPQAPHPGHGLQEDINLVSGPRGRHATRCFEEGGRGGGGSPLYKYSCWEAFSIREVTGPSSTSNKQTWEKVPQCKSKT